MSRAIAVASTNRSSRVAAAVRPSSHSSRVVAEIALRWIHGRREGVDISDLGVIRAAWFAELDFGCQRLGIAPLDEQAKTFDQLLSSLRAGSTNGELKTALDDVASKWQFIRGSYINYNENNVGFVIDRYSKGIIEGLTNAIDLLRASTGTCARGHLIAT